MYTDVSTTSEYPKTLLIRNHRGGMVWQIYHVHKQIEAERLAANASLNRFDAITLEDYQPELAQTWPDWRETAQGIIND